MVARPRTLARSRTFDSLLVAAMGFVVLPVAAPAAGEIVGIWNFTAADADGRVPNSRPGGGGSPAVLRDFDAESLAGTDVVLGDFTIVRDDTTTQVQVATSGWATFANVPDNGLDPGVATPVGPKALAVHAANPGNWVHLPGVAGELVGRPGGAVRSFGVALWVLVPTEQIDDRARFVSLNPLIRFAATDARLFLHQTVSDRIHTEDVGNGLGGARSYQIPWGRRLDATSRWVHLVMTGDGTANEFCIWVNGEAVNYTEPGQRSVPWPVGGGMQLSYRPGEPSDGAVLGRWLGGGAAPGKTFGLAAIVITAGEPITQERARHLHQLGRRGLPFDGTWPTP